MLERGYTEGQHTTRWRSIALALVITIAGFLAANALLGRYLDRNGPNLGYRYVAYKWALLGESEPVDWLVLGDSTVNQGFDPRHLEEQTGLRGLNLGTIGNFGTIDDLWMLEEYLERHGPPKAVVVVHTYDVWIRRFHRPFLGRIPRARPLTRETKRAFKIKRKDRREIAINRYMRLYAERRSLRKSLKFAYLDATRSEEEMAALRVSDRDLPLRDPVMTETGYVEMCGAIPEVVRRDYRGHVKHVSSQKFELSGDNRRALEAMMRLADERGFELYIAPGPLYEHLPKKRAFKRYYASLQATLRELANQHPRAHFIEGLKTFPEEQMQNADHITCDAAPIYTDWLTEQVKATQPASGAQP